MCGFAGVLATADRPSGFPIREVLAAMGNRVAHRGPDDDQYYLDEHLGVAFRRLSIVDPVAGAQPLTNEDGSLVLVLNGEIYNYQQIRGLLKNRHCFKTRSDCEVVLHLYEEMGIHFLDHLNGMFALALWDRHTQTLLIARDRLGIKPLYFHLAADRLIFGSEIKALLAYPDCPRELDWTAALMYAVNPIDPGSPINSFFKNIEQLPGGHYLSYQVPSRQLQRRAYWQLPSPTDEPDRRTLAEIIGGYRDLLEDSVKLQLMSDADVGLFLSGGIDSVSIAYLTAQQTKLKTFSVLSQSTFRNGDVEAGVKAAQFCGLENHQVMFHWHGNEYDQHYWKNLLWHLETPLCSAEHLYKYELHGYVKTHYPQVKTILLGQGSDEFNGGYAQQFVSAQHPAFKPQGNNWELFMDNLRFQRKATLLAGRAAGLGAYSYLLTQDFAYGMGHNMATQHPWEYYVAIHAHSLQMNNLWHEDRTAAAHGIENRVPFLDHRLVEYTIRVPQHHWRELFWDKQILRRGFANELPVYFTDRPKVPFFHGDDVRYTYRMLYNMLIKDNNALFYEALGEPTDVHPVLERPVLETILQEIKQTVEYTAVTKLMPLVNMALLERMASDIGFSPTLTMPVACSRVLIQDYDQQVETLALQLGVRRTSIDLTRPLMLAGSVQLLHNKQNQTYVAVEGELAYLMEDAGDKAWLQVLEKLDGHTSLTEILAQLSISEASIRTHLEEALDCQLVLFL